MGMIDWSLMWLNQDLLYAQAKMREEQTKSAQIKYNILKYWKSHTTFWKC